ncbi:DUF3558 family protein [Amycolatopsis pigmentata]|uniref:DUF3558 family protein n=1 Tax=Amycolatopsis pigmentata TaxID=450801 RepID=A0ABW5FVI6_9PSEU
MTTKTSTVGRVAVLATVAALGLTGCSSTTPGTAFPSTGATSTGTTTTGNANVFSALNACQVLDQLLTGQGFDPGENISRRNECDASKLNFGTYSIALDPARGLSEYRTENSGAMTTTINGRNALQAKPSAAMCEFALEVGQHARALATATMAESTANAQACPSAKQLAEKLEPLLPKDQ